MSFPHGYPDEESFVECHICYTNLDRTSYVEYRLAPISTDNLSGEGPWLPSLFCSSCTMHLLNTQFGSWMSKISTVDCPVAFQRMISEGPPEWLKDKHGYPDASPFPAPEREVRQLWFLSDKQELEARLKHSVSGKERQELWDKLAQEHLPRIQKLIKERESNAVTSDILLKEQDD